MRYACLVDNASDEGVSAHGRVVVEVTGALLPTLVLPQQA